MVGLRFLLFAVLSCLPLALAVAQDSPEQMLAKAQRLERSGNLVEAAKLFETFIKDHGKHTQVLEAHYRLAKCYDGQGRIEDSIEQLKKVAQSDNKRYRNRAEAFYMLGKQYAALKDYKRAVVVFDNLLSEGAGLHEDEVLNLAGGYYAILGDHNEAATKFTILKGKKDSLLAEDAFYKLAMLWLKVGQLDRSVEAVQDLARAYPTNKQIPGLMFRLAQLLQEQKKFADAIALCGQLKSSFSNSYESVAGQYVIALCHRDQRQSAQAVKVLEALAADKNANKQGLAQEAMFLAAQLTENNLKDKDAAIGRYERTVAVSRASQGQRSKQILEQCHFRVAEYHFREANWAAALDNYVALRRLGTGINVLGRILECQAKLDRVTDVNSLSTADADLIRKKIDENPGTIAAAEAEVLLLDRQLNQQLKRRGAVAADLAKKYEELLTKYPDDVLGQNNLKAYVLGQVGNCFFNATEPDQIKRARDAYQTAASLIPKDNHTLRIPTLENLALVAERMDDMTSALAAYDELLEISKGRLAKKPDDEALQRKTVDYLRSLVTRSDTPALLDKSIAMCQESIDSAAQAAVAREARYYLGELLYMKKDYSGAAKAFRDFIRIYGPKQNDDGELASAPFTPKGRGTVDEKTAQLYESAVRIAQAWYVQGHHQNMIAAYQWMTRNFPTNNKHMAEAAYWLALENLKPVRRPSKAVDPAASGSKAGTALEGHPTDDERKLMWSRTADALWKHVVNSSVDFRDKDFAKTFKPWVRTGPGRKYAKPACLKAAEYYGKAGQHELAARVLEQYLKLFPRFPVDARTRRTDTSKGPDPMFDMAHYALIREYVSLGEVGRMVAHCEAYVDGMRNSRFRIAALQAVGFHAGRDERFQSAIRAYATLLDEFGDNELDDDGKPIPVPVEKRLRQEKLTWNGIRQPIPTALDVGNVRYSLGYWYWQQGFWERCAQVLTPFIDNHSYAKLKSRPQALYMLGRSRWKVRDFVGALPALEVVVTEHPDFAAAEEVCTYVADGMLRTKRYEDVVLLHERFVKEWPSSTRRHRMDYSNAVAQIELGNKAAGLPVLKSLIAGETYEDVKADAYYQMAMVSLNSDQPNDDLAIEFLENSIKTFLRDHALLSAAKVYVRKKRWKDADTVLKRVIEEFPDGEPALQEEARQLLPVVEKGIESLPKE